MKHPGFYASAGLVIAVLVGGLIAWPRENHPTGVQPEPTTPAAPSTAGIDGAKLYDRLCDKCHGLKVATYGPALTTPSNVRESALSMLIVRGIPEGNMPALEEKLSPAELAALVKFTRENALPKSPEDRQRLAVGAGAAPTKMNLSLVQVQNSDLVARATLLDAKGAPIPRAMIVFNLVSSLNGRVPLANLETSGQGLAIYYYPIKPGELARIEAAYEGAPGRQPSAALDQAESPKAAPALDPLAAGLSSATPLWGLVALIAIAIGSVWLIYVYIFTLLLRISDDGSDPAGQKPKAARQNT